MKKIYLDTNILYSYFKEILNVPTEKKIPISIQKLQKREASRLKNSQYWTSCIAKYECFKNVKNDFDIYHNQFESIWKSLTIFLNISNISYIRKKAVIKILESEILEEYLRKYKFKSGLTDIDNCTAYTTLERSYL